MLADSPRSLNRVWYYVFELDQTPWLIWRLGLPANSDTRMNPMSDLPPPLDDSSSSSSWSDVAEESASPPHPRLGQDPEPPEAGYLLGGLVGLVPRWAQQREQSFDGQISLDDSWLQRKEAMQLATEKQR